MRYDYRNTNKTVSSYLGTIVFSILLAFVCWSATFLFDAFDYQNALTNNSVWNHFTSKLSNIEAYIMGFAIMGCSAFLLQRTNYMMNIIRVKTAMPLLFFVLFFCSAPRFIPLTSATPALLLLVLAIYFLFKSYHYERSQGYIFNAFFMIGLSSLLWTQIIWIIPVFWLGMYKFRILNPRNVGACLIGLFMVYWFAFAWSFYRHTPEELINNFKLVYALNPIRINATNWPVLIQPALLVILYLISLFHLITNQHSENIRSRDYLSFLSWLTFAMLILGCLFNFDQGQFIQLSIVPCSVLVGHFFALNSSRGASLLFSLVVTSYILTYAYQLWIF